MKKSKLKLSLNKKSISNLDVNEIIGGVSGRTCELTNKYYKTCYTYCPTPATWNDCLTFNCGNTVRVCDH
ncbi:hypothetical protein [Kordia jejudonensis]|uniref:hypothetical protein n=1 Tax=Kordia jejudonensis TaxID=1348245 RepID=UPI0012E08FA5|nr:hypothetical protein [Kordia jejudonensis]